MDKISVPYPEWKIVRRIGSGSYGTVYEIERDLFGNKAKAALKILSIPQNEGDVEELRCNGYDDESITAHFSNYLKDIIREYSLMEEIKGHTNVVYCDDVRYIQKDQGFGWDIFIKMELLKPLTTYLGSVVPEAMAVKLGKDICKALALCKSRNIVHRDIKPQNIFVSRDEDFKLGDFGIAKTVEKTSGGTKIGTFDYMAPEVYNNQPYGHSADIYSLGLVLYWLLNERRMPFRPLPPTIPKTSDIEKSRLRRFRGEALPPPAHGSEELKRIVLKACAYDPADRYVSAEEMLRDLEQLKNETAEEDRQESFSPIPNPEVETAAMDDDELTTDVFDGKHPGEFADRANRDDYEDRTIGIFCGNDDDITYEKSSNETSDLGIPADKSAEVKEQEASQDITPYANPCEKETPVDGFATKKQQQEYEIACLLQETAKTLEEFANAAAVFEKPRLRNYRDSAERAKQCREAEQSKTEEARRVTEAAQSQTKRKAIIIGVSAWIALMFLLYFFIG